MFYSLALPPVSGPGGGRWGNQQKELTTRTQFWPLDRKWTQSVGLFSCMWFRSLLCSVVSLAALLGAFAVGGCAYQLNSLAAKSTMEAAAKHDEKPSEVDLAYARAVAAASLGATRITVSAGKTQTPAPAATSRRSPCRIPRVLPPAAISSRATCASVPRLGCRARLAVPITASGR